jgi:hypothetical protein
MAMSSIAVISGGLTEGGITTKVPSYGHRCWLDFQTSLGNMMGEFVFGRFNEACAVTGAPVALTYDATRGIWVFTITYAAALAYSYGGLTLSNGYAQGDYGYVQVKGPNVVTVQSNAAMTAGLQVQKDTGANNKVIEIANATTADHLKGFAILHKAQGGAGTIGVGEMSLLGKF